MPINFIGSCQEWTKRILMSRIAHAVYEEAMALYS